MMIVASSFNKQQPKKSTRGILILYSGSG